jgi:hypothetical protein
MPSDALSPAELLALERQFLRDRDLPDSQLQARDREIGRDAIAATGGAMPSRVQLLSAWLRGLGDDTLADTRRLSGAFRLLDIGLLLGGLILGGSGAAGLLHYDGSTPINLLHFLALFVLLQALSILLWLAALLFLRGGRAAPTGGALHAILGTLLRGLLRRALPAERRQSLGRDVDWLRAVGGYYHNVERWLLSRATQLFALGFNSAAVASTAVLMATSDLSFVWRSTIDWPPEQLHHLLRLLATPWARILPQAVPSLDLVIASRHFRGAGAPVLSPERLSTWWAFLLTALVVYGLLPRLLTWGFSAWALRRTLRRLPLDHGDFEDLQERLTLPLVEMPGREPLRPVETAAAASGDSARPMAEFAWAIIWKDAPISLSTAQELLVSRYDLPLERLLHAGGGLDPGTDSRAIEALAELPSKAIPLLLIEAFEAPTREATAFLRSLRAATSRPFRILLLQPGPSNEWLPASDLALSVWRQGLQVLRDPHIQVHTLRRALPKAAQTTSDSSREGSRS